MDVSENNNNEHSAIEQLTDNHEPTKPSKRSNKRMAASTIESTQNGNGTGSTEKTTRERKIGLLPTASEEKSVSYAGKVVGEVTWSTLPCRSLFSANADGSHPYIKLSKSSFEDLITEEVTTGVPAKSQQKFYRVKLQ